MSLQINQLTRVTPSVSQIVPVYDPSLGDTRSWSVTELITLLQAQLTFPISGRLEPTMQYAAPSASGFSVAITDDDKDIHLVLTPTAGFAEGTIILPALLNLRDSQILIVNCTQAVATLTIDANGAIAVTGAPTALLANDFFTLKYDAITQTWYRIS